MSARVPISVFDSRSAVSRHVLDVKEVPTFVHVLRRRALCEGNEIAYEFIAGEETSTPSSTITYAELDRRARGVAARLQQMGFQGERMLLLYPPGPDYIAAFLGCLYAGALPVPVYPPRRNRSMGRLLAIARESGARAALTTERILSGQGRESARPAELDDLLWMATDDPSTSDPSAWIEPDIDPASPAFLQFTSGSTSDPKGVVISHANLIHNSAAIRRCFQTAPEKPCLVWLPPYHDMGLIGGILQPLFAGSVSTILSPVSFLQKPYCWLEAMSSRGAVISGAPNFAFDLCVRTVTREQRDALDLSSWEVAFCGSEPVHPETLDRFARFFGPCGFRREAFYPCYGLAESTLFVSGGNPRAVPRIKYFDTSALGKHRVIEYSHNGSPQQRALVGVGSYLPQQIAIVDPATRRSCAPDQIGEIWISGPSVASGYWNRPLDSEETFGARIDGSNPATFLRTGDLGFFSDGELFVVGRLKELIIIRGHNHYPRDLEVTAGKSHQALHGLSGAAFSIERDGEERLVIAHEVSRSWRNADPAPILDAIRVAVAEAHELEVDTIVLTPPLGIPKTSSGKVQRLACRAAILDGTLPEIARWPAEARRDDDTPTEPVPEEASSDSIGSWLVARIAQMLRLRPSEVDIYKPFQYLGLDSLSSVRISGELEERLGVRLSPTLIWDYPNIDALARFLSATPVSSTPPREERAAMKGNDPIAIIGLGCRFPDAGDPESFWRLLRDGRDAITRIPPSRRATGDWQGDDWGGYLAEVDRFDAAFFGIAPREAIHMDPQQRLLLEVAWEALEHAGTAPENLARTPTGVFIGISNNDYRRLDSSINAYSGTGNATSIAANRISYVLGLNGPSMAVDTACSSSLVAVHLAARSLRNGECDAALAGGVNLILSDDLTSAFAQAQMLAPDGRCKTFDAAADGYVRGEGCGVVVLKRLADAVRDGDPIVAVIRGSALNQDGRSNGLTAPNGPSQEAVIRAALADAGAQPCDVGYVEAHGTGTPLGDPIEMRALANAYGQGRAADRPLVVGSVKTNIGHLEAAAGIAGLMKVALALNKRSIPPHLHFTRPSPHIAWTDIPVVVPADAREWPEGSSLAAISSFGFGGTNAHVILEAPPPHARAADHDETPERPLHILALSAPTAEALHDLAGRYGEHLAASADALADIAYTANIGRNRFAHRAAVVGATAGEMREKLAALTGTSTEPPRVAFLFSGQGSQYAGMARQLYETQPLFRRILTECDALLRHEIPLLSTLYGDDGAHIDETAYTQPALFAIEFALAQLWRSWGIEPSVVIGHSVGELVAACVAGVYTLEEGLKLVAARGRLMRALPVPGAMAAILADEETVAAALNPGLSIAAVNGPTETVIAGDADALDDALTRFESAGVVCRRLQVSHAFHSALMEPMLDAFETEAAAVTFCAPSIPLISNVTGAVAGDEIRTASYWRRHVRATVRFRDGVRAAAARGCNVFVEIGPRPKLLATAHASVGDEGARWLPSLRNNAGDWQTILDSLRVLQENGAPIDWRGFDAGYARRRVAVPTYPFQRQSYWVARTERRAAQKDPAAHPLLGARLASPLSQTQFESDVARHAPPFLADHQLHGSVVFPATGWIEIVLAAAAALEIDTPIIESFVIESPLILEEPASHRLQAIVTRVDEERVTIGIHHLDAGGGWRLQASARVCTGVAEERTAGLSMLRHGFTETSVAGHYDRLRDAGLEYGPAFRGLTEAWRGNGEAFGRVQVADERDAARYRCHPALLDAALHLLGMAMPEATSGAYIPVAIDRLQVTAAGLSQCWAHARLRAGANDDTRIADIDLYDDDGHRIGAIDGLRLRHVVRERWLPASVDDWLYEVEWRPLPIPAAAATLEPGRCLVLADDTGIVGAAVASELAAHGHDVTLAAYDGAVGSGPWRAVVSCGSDVDQALRLVQRLAGQPARLWIVTQGGEAVAAGDDPASEAAALRGFARVVALEHPELHCRRADLPSSPSRDDVAALCDEIALRDHDDEVAFRGTPVRRLVARLVKSPARRAAPSQLTISQPGVLDTLALTPRPRRAPGAGEVEIAVRAAGLNFRDVLIALGMYPGDAPPLGGEAAGVVTAAGRGSGWKAGDAVLVLAPGTFASVAVADARLVARKPESMSFDDAATIPIAFLTAHYALERIAQIRPGETVLVHAAAGGVGMAAVQIALRAGARVFATASPSKWDVVRAMGVEDVMSSRTLDFAGDVARKTGGRGVDVIINSLSGDFIEKSLGILAPGGRFIEIGKRDVWDEARVQRFRGDIRYTRFDLAEVARETPEEVGEALRALLQRFADGALSALPTTRFPLANAAAAFRYMTAAKHAGKIILTGDDSGPRAEMRLREDRAYLVTGGTGALGMHVAAWMAGRGAREIVLVARNAPSPDTESKIDELRRRGVSITIVLADVARRDELAGAMCTSAPLAGVVHCAGTLDDALIAGQTAERFARVMAPKVVGAQNLHELTRELDLDFFVLYSSLASVAGSPGQANYAAANACLDSLAHHRRLLGLPALAINWGAWSGEGMAARSTRAANGIDTIPPEAGVYVLDALLQQDRAQVTVLPADWNRFTRHYAGRPIPPLFADFAKPAGAPSPVLQAIRQADAKKRKALLTKHIREQVATVLGLDAARPIDPQQGLSALGMDSLMAVELGARLQASLGCALPATVAFEHPNIDSLAAHLMETLFPMQSPRSPALAVTAAARDLDDLSEDELTSLLARNLAQLDPRRAKELGL